MIGAHGSLPTWGKWPEWWYGEEEPPETGGQSPETQKKSGLVSVKDGSYTWVVYKNGDIKLFNVPAGKEHLIGSRYRIGDANYAAILSKLRKLSSHVDEVLAQGGLDGKKLAQGQLVKPQKKKKSAPKPSYAPPSPPTSPTSSQMQPLDILQPKPFPWWTIPVGFVVLMGLGLLVFRRKKGGKKK